MIYTVTFNPAIDYVVRLDRELQVGDVNRARGEEEGQLLYSYRIDFDFRSDAGELNYLKGASFKVQKVGFVDKYFPGQIF